jgi:hypothetical protein
MSRQWAPPCTFVYNNRRPTPIRYRAYRGGKNHWQQKNRRGQVACHPSGCRSRSNWRCPADGLVHCTSAQRKKTIIHSTPAACARRSPITDRMRSRESASAFGRGKGRQRRRRRSLRKASRLVRLRGKRGAGCHYLITPSRVRLCVSGQPRAAAPPFCGRGPRYKSHAPTIPAVIAWLDQAGLYVLLQSHFDMLAFCACRIFPYRLGGAIRVGYRENCVCDSDMSLPRFRPQLKTDGLVEIIIYVHLNSPPVSAFLCELFLTFLRRRRSHSERCMNLGRTLQGRHQHIARLNRTNLTASICRRARAQDITIGWNSYSAIFVTSRTFRREV